MCNNMLYARVLQTYGVNHTIVATLRDAREGVTITRLAGSTFEGYTAKAIDGKSISAYSSTISCKDKY